MSDDTDSTTSSDTPAIGVHETTSATTEAKAMPSFICPFHGLVEGVRYIKGKKVTFSCPKEGCIIVRDQKDIEYP